MFWWLLKYKAASRGYGAGELIKEAIQVCYDLTEENRARKIDGITEAMEEFRLGEGLVITGDLEGEAEISCGTVSYKPLWKWLLG